MKTRLNKLRQMLSGKDLDSIIIASPKNRSYISGVSSSDGYLIVSKDDAVLALDSRYAAWASRQASPSDGIRVLQIQGDMQKWLPDIVSSMNISSMGFEDTRITYSTYVKLMKALDSSGEKAKLVPISNMVSGLRSIKDAGELKLVKKAADVALAAFEQMKQQVKPGMTEKEVSWLLECCLRGSGSSSLPFGIIVASGPNAAFPHHAATDRPIAEGDPVIIDFGARISGYGSDITRTLCLGEPTDRFKEIYNVVLNSQRQAFNKIESGMTGHQADATARDYITDAGYGEFFLHALGHSTGLEVHEEPRLGQNSEDVLEDGMVFTIEPGIYIQGWGGVRIEDMVVLENGKPRWITQALKDLY